MRFVVARLQLRQQEDAMTISLLGWAAAAVFAGSYFFRQTVTLKKVQGAAASLWIIYGVAIGAAPVVVANLVAGTAAVYSLFRRRSGWKDEWSARIKAGNGGSSRREIHAGVGLK
jgi:hypothetical protein